MDPSGAQGVLADISQGVTSGYSCKYCDDQKQHSPTIWCIPPHLTVNFFSYKLFSNFPLQRSYIIDSLNHNRDHRRFKTNHFLLSPIRLLQVRSHQIRKEGRRTGVPRNFILCHAFCSRRCSWDLLLRSFGTDLASAT